MFKKLSDVLDFQSPKQGKSKDYSGPGSSFNFLSLIHKWPEIVGPKLSQVTIPIKNQRRTLTILTEHPAYSQSLSFLEATLKEKIYRVFPELKDKIDRFYFQVNTEHFKEERDKMVLRSQAAPNTPPPASTAQDYHPHNPRYRKLKNEAKKHFTDVPDDEMKEALENIFVQLSIRKTDLPK